MHKISKLSIGVNICYYKYMNITQNWSIIILAAGKGTRLKSPTPKPLVEIKGVPLIQPIIEKAAELNLPTIISISPYTAAIKERFNGLNISYCLAEPLGTGYSASEALKLVKTKYVIIAQADDSFFYSKETLERLIEEHNIFEADCTLGIYNIKEQLPYGWAEYQNTKLIKIHKSPEDKLKKSPKDVVCGLYAFNSLWLQNALKTLRTDQSGEIPLPGVFDYAISNNSRAMVFKVPDGQWRGINTQEELKIARDEASNN